MPGVDKNLEKGSEEKGGPIVREKSCGFTILGKCLVSIVLGCQKSWNELCKYRGSY